MDKQIRNIGDFAAAFREWTDANPLRKLRKRKGLSQAVLGAVIGLGHHRVSDFENGLAFPSEKQLIAIGRALGDKAFAEAWGAWMAEKPEIGGVHGNGKGKRADAAG